MSRYFSVYRPCEDTGRKAQELKLCLESFTRQNRIREKSEIRELFKNLDMLLSQCAVSSAMVYEADECGSRGAGLVTRNGKIIGEKSGAGDYVFVQYPVFYGEKLLFENKKEPCRPIPERDNWFENIWREYRKRNNIDDI